MKKREIIRNFIEKKLPYLNPLVNFLFGEKAKQVFPTLKCKDYIDPTKTVEEKIRLEIRRRNQFYTTLEYCLESYTYYDYMTPDVLKIINRAYSLTQFVDKKIVDTDYLLLAFCSIDGCVSLILKKYGLTKIEIQKFLSFSIQRNPEQIKKIKKNQKEAFFYSILKNFSFLFPVSELEKNRNLRTSEELDDLFEKAAENAMLKYKTPIISTEILFLTLMEEKQLKGGKILQFFLEEENEKLWYFIRYDLLKSLYHDEIGIRTQLSLGEQYYAYLLKSQISELDFKLMIRHQNCESTVKTFRNQLIEEVLKFNIYDFIKEDVRRTMKINAANTTRIYYETDETEIEKKEEQPLEKEKEVG